MKYSATRLNISWIAVEFPANATAMISPFGGMLHTLAFMLLEIHSKKSEEPFFLHIEHLLVHFFRGRATMEKCRSGEGNTHGVDLRHTS